MNIKTKRAVVSVANVLLPLVFALAVGAVCLLMIGRNPLEIYGFLVQKTLLDPGGLMNSLGYATPLLMTGIATALSYSANVYNMGIEGQMYIGSWFATWIGFTVTGLSKPLHIALCLVGGAVLGMLYALVPAILKACFKINEVVTTIMLNNVAIIFTSYLTNGPFADNVGYAATYAVAETAQISRINSRYRVTWAIFIAVGILLLVWILMKKTRLGYEISALGKQKEFADAVGMRVSRKIFVVFMIGGAIAGVAGATEIMGVNIRFTPSWSVNPGLGWDGQAVCLLANRSPIGILVTAILFGAFKYGGVVLQSKMGISLDIVNIIKSALILFLAARYLTVDAKIFQKLGAKRREARAKEA